MLSTLNYPDKYPIIYRVRSQFIILKLPRGEKQAQVAEQEQSPEAHPAPEPVVTPPKTPEAVAIEKPAVGMVKPEPVVLPPAKTPEQEIPAIPLEASTQVLMGMIRQINPGPAVRTVVGMDSDPGDFRLRTDAMKQLTRNLSTNDTTALRLFLNFRFREQDKNAGLRLLEFEGLKNDALTVLLAQDRLPAGLGHQLAGMYRDSDHSEVWRAYCIQYIPECYQQRWPAVKEPEPEKGQEMAPERLEMENTCWEALEDADSTIKGTALLALECLSGKYDHIDRGRVEEAALSMAVDDACEEPARITSMRICGMAGRKEVLPAARMIAQTGETVPLRMAAIATLGDLGEDEDVELLESLAASTDKRVQNIAKATLARLKNK